MYVILIRKIPGIPPGMGGAFVHLCQLHHYHMVLKELHTLHYPGPPGSIETSKPLLNPTSHFVRYVCSYSI